MAKNKHAPKSFIDRDGQEYVSMAELSRRVGVSTAALLFSRDRGHTPSIKKDGYCAYPWPQARDAYLSHAKLLDPDSGDGGGPGPTNYPGGYDASGQPPIKKNNPEFADPFAGVANKNVYSAALLQLEYEQRIGNLVPMDVVDAVWTGAGENLKKTLMSIPDRIAPQYGGDNHHKLYRALVEEFTHALSSLNITYDFPAVRKAGRPAGK